MATFGLLAVIWGCARLRSSAVPFAVATYITAAYWFTASTSFANPAVTLARSATDTFAGIRPSGRSGVHRGSARRGRLRHRALPLADTAIRMTRLVIRLGTVEDAPAIARIHNEGIADRIATFETEPRTAAQVAAALGGLTTLR